MYKYTRDTWEMHKKLGKFTYSAKDWRASAMPMEGVAKGQRSRRERARAFPLAPRQQGLRAVHSSRKPGLT